jgi:hypothetical protein
MKAILSGLILCVMMALALPAMAQDRTLRLIPTISPYVKTGVGAYHSMACPCFDRGSWSTDMGLNLQWHRFLGVEGEFRYGTMLLGGNFPRSGHALGLRSGLGPEPTRWWNDFYVRSGWTYLSVMGTRDPGYHGVYLHPGWSVGLYGPLALDLELAGSYFFGAMAHLDLGFRAGLKVSFW